MRMKSVLRATLLMLFVAGAFVLLAWIPGRMTGGGSIFTEDGMRVTHGFELYCQYEKPDGTIVTPGPNNLEINWEGNRFHLEDLTYSECDNLPNVDPKPPKAPFSYYYGEGFGRLNGQPGAKAVFTFVDAGEPGREDWADITIFDSSGSLVLATGREFLAFGNHQAHKANQKDK
jgi:hypothetical protein